MKLNSIDLIFNYEGKNNEVKIKASIDGDIGWQQWGEAREVLSDNVGLVEALNNAAQEYFLEGGPEA